MQKNCADTLFGLNSGMYKVDINTVGTCSNGTSDFYLHGIQTPVALFTASADTAQISSSVSFTNSSSKAGNYWWDFGDGMGMNYINPSHYYASTGTYTVTLIAYGSACSDSSVYSKEINIINQTTEINQVGEKNNKTVIGRDVNGYYVKFNYTAKQDAVISVSDLFGQKIGADEEVKNIQSEKIYVTGADYQNTILIISVFSSTGEKTYKKIIN